MKWSLGLADNTFELLWLGLWLGTVSKLLAEWYYRRHRQQISSIVTFRIVFWGFRPPIKLATQGHFTRLLLQGCRKTVYISFRHKRFRKLCIHRKWRYCALKIMTKISVGISWILKRLQAAPQCTVSLFVVNKCSNVSLCNFRKLHCLNAWKRIPLSNRTIVRTL